MNGILTRPLAIGRIINRALHSRSEAVPSFGRGLVPMSVRRAIRVPTRSIVLPSLRRPRSPNGDAANTYSIPRPRIADRSRCCFFAVLTANRGTALSHNFANREVRRGACYSPVFSAIVLSLITADAIPIYIFFSLLCVILQPKVVCAYGQYPW